MEKAVEKIYVYAPFIYADQAIEPVASMIELHDKNGTMNGLPWFTDRDTLLEYIRHAPDVAFVSSLIQREPHGVSCEAYAMGAMLVEVICAENNIQLPSWVSSDSARFDMRSPYFSKITRQKSMRTYLQKNRDSIFLKHGMLQEIKDYRTV